MHRITGINLSGLSQNTGKVAEVKYHLTFSDLFNSNLAKFLRFGHWD